MGHITEAVVRLAIAHPQVHFSLTHGGRLVHDLPPVDALRSRIAALFGQPIAESLIEIDSRDEDVWLHGYVANPSHSRANNRLQYLLLNGRYIRDRALQHALGEAYRGLLLTGRYPVCFLQLEISPSLVDVNVHPTKLEVRFQDAGRLYSQLLGALRSKFLTTDLVARGAVPEQPFNASAGDEIAQSSPTTSELFDWAKRQTTRTGSEEALRLHTVSLPSLPAAGNDREAADTASFAGEKESVSKSSSLQDPSLRVDQAGASTPSGPRALQIHNRYLVVENDDGLEVIDQHALHERILYELLREKVLAGVLESQRLLVPEPVDLAASEAAAVLENRELLRHLGLEVEPFGGETVLVAAYPAMLANFSPSEVIHSLVEKLQTDGKQTEARDVLDDLMHMIACKAAVKYGDRLTPEEVEALLAQRHLAQDHHHCPHGRPTALIFTREQLDRQFKRI